MKPQLAYRSPNQSRAKVVDLVPYLNSMATPGHVSGIEALWSTLLERALESWSWRDPDSLAALDAVLGELRELVLTDWQQPHGADG
jgi:hypothetical protein